MTTPALLPPLSGQAWSDERILDETIAHDRGTMTNLYASLKIVARQMRDEYEAELATAQARIAELEAELARPGVLRNPPIGKRREVTLPCEEDDDYAS